MMTHSFSNKSVKKTVLFLLAAALLLLFPTLLPKTHAAQAKVRLNKESADLVPGYTLQLKVKGTSQPVTWKSGK